MIDTAKLNTLIRDIPIPPRMRDLPVSEKGFPVPWFVGWVDGVPDFRVVPTSKYSEAIKFRKCWICGETTGTHLVFVIGPMCGVNRVTSEPPCHRDCAEYAVRACPFLVNPRARRNEKDMPDGHEPGGVMIRRNPGVSALWFTRGYQRFRAPGGSLIRIDPAERVDWYREGRRATRAEVLTSVESGLPQLEGMAWAQGREAITELRKARDDLDKWLPKDA